MPRSPRQPTRRRPGSRSAPALLALALAGCAVPNRLPVRTQTVPAPHGVAPAEAASPADRPRAPGGALARPVLPPSATAPPLPEATVRIGPLDADGPSAEGGVPPAPGHPPADRVLARGMASWYGPQFHGRRTASGERYDMHALTAAHKTLPFGARVRVRSVHTGKEVVVRINDRGPYKHQRIIDLSRGAVVALGVLDRGVTEVELLRE